MSEPLHPSSKLAEMDVPFRWDVARREQLGRLPAGVEAESYPEFLEDLRICSARIVALSDESDLVFIGRSPESIFDYLSGALSETTWSERLAILNLSVRNIGAAELRIGSGADVHVLRRHLSALHLTPREIASRPRTIALVDLVSSGGTFENVATALTEWARDERFDLNAVRRRLRFIGITWRTKTSPNTRRWHQDAPWLAAFRPSAVKNISIPGRMWGYLGNNQKKVSRTQPQRRWQDTEWRTSPPREAENLESLRLALRIFETARARPEKREFARELARQPALSKPWLRSLLAELKKTAATV